MFKIHGQKPVIKSAMRPILCVQCEVNRRVRTIAGLHSFDRVGEQSSLVVRTSALVLSLVGLKLKLIK